MNSKSLLTALPLLFAASCVPPPAAWSGRQAIDAARTAEAEAAPPPSSLGQLTPEAEAQWQRAAGSFEAPSLNPALPFEQGEGEVDRSRALDCLATAIYYEARSESDDGQKAVAQVVLNRVRHPAFPSSVCGVVYQGSQRRTGCQFSFTCDGSMARRPRGGSWERAQRIAAAALGGEVYAPVGNATHYHTTAILPYWAPSLTRSAVIGAHVFYRWRGAAGRSAAFRQGYSGEDAPVVRASAWVAEREAETAPAQVDPVEHVRVSTGTVKIHRGGTSDVRPAATAEAFGVRVHRGGAPSEI